MNVLSAMRTGSWAAVSSPRVWVALWLLELVFALPAAWVVREAIHDSVAHTAHDTRLADGFDPIWYAEFHDGARGPARAFDPTLHGTGASLDRAERWLTFKWKDLPRALLVPIVLFALLRMLFLGAVLERFCTDDARGVRGMTRAAGRYAFRLARAAAALGGLYALVFLAQRRAGDWAAVHTEHLAAERPLARLMLTIWVVSILLMIAVHTLAGYTRVVLVAEERRSAMSALWTAFRFVLRHPLRALALEFGFLGLAGLTVVALSRIGPATTWTGIWVGLLGLQAALLVQAGLRVAAEGSRLDLYRQFFQRFTDRGDEAVTKP